MSNRAWFGAALVLAASACGGPAAPGPEPQVAPPVSPPPPQPPPAASAGPVATPLRPEAGHNLAMLAAACWFGGIWGDAEGETEETRGRATEARCHDVVRRVYGKDDDDRYKQLRALEPSVVGDIAGKVEALAKEDSDDAPRSQTLGQLVQAVAGAEREAMFARRAASRVKRDLDHEPEKLSADDAAAVEPLKDTRMLEALLKFQGGDITHDAHALGMLAALDHVEVARNVPRHLKIYAIGGPNQLLFGVPLPDTAVDPGTGKPKRSRTYWLDYLLTAATAAGHPVPAGVTVNKKREPLAWGGMLEGYADKLRGDIDGLAKDTRLHNVASVVVQRLDAEFRAQQNALTGPSSPPSKGGPGATK